MGRFRYQRIIDSGSTWCRDPWGSSAGCRFRIHDQNSFDAGMAVLS